MKVLRTPDPCFAGLEGYDFEPHYSEVTGDDGPPLRIPHVDDTAVNIHTKSRTLRVDSLHTAPRRKRAPV